MDLLDSLVIPYSQQEEAKEVLKKYPSLMLAPTLKKNSKFDKFILEDIDDEFKNVINDFLNSISILMKPIEIVNMSLAILDILEMVL